MVNYNIIIDIGLPTSLPDQCSVQYLVKHYLDINSVPRRSFFEMLTYFADNELEKEKLQEFCTAEGQVSFIYGLEVTICLFCCI